MKRAFFRIEGVGLLVQQETFGLDGSLTTRACGRDGLTIDWVGTVACDEDAWELGAWRAVNLLQIARLVSFQPFAEDIGIRLVADSKEESVNLDINLLFVGFAFTLDEVSAFYAIFTEEPQSVVLKQYLDVLSFHDALLHHL